MPTPVRSELHHLVHDLNNVLLVVMAHAELLSDTLGPGTHQHDTANAITQAALRGAGMVERLRRLEPVLPPQGVATCHTGMPIR